MRRLALLVALAALLGCNYVGGLRLSVEQVAHRQLPLLGLWELQVQVTNGTRQPLRLDPADFALTDSAGEVHTAGLSAVAAGLGLRPIITLTPGSTGVTTLTFPLPPDRTLVSLRHNPSGKSLRLEGIVGSRSGESKG